MAPGNWNTEDRKARVKAVADSKPSKGLFQWTSEVNVGFPHLTDSLGSWTTFNLVCGTDKQLKSMASQVFDISKDHKIAFQADRNWTKSKWLKIRMIALTRMNGLLAYVKGDLLKKKWDAGIEITEVPIFDKMAAIVSFDLKEQKEGNKVENHKLMVCGESKWSDSTTFKVKANADTAGDLTLSGGAVIKMSEHVGIRLFDHIKPMDAWKNKNWDSYNLGVTLDFTY